MKNQKPKPRAKKNQITDVSKMVDKPRAEEKNICYREVVRLAVNELIPFEQVEPFKRLAIQLDLRVSDELFRREQEVREVLTEKLTVIRNYQNPYEFHEERVIWKRALDQAIEAVKMKQS